MSGNIALSFCVLLLAALFILSTECRYFENLEKRDKTAEYFLRKGAQNSVQFKRGLSNIDSRKDGSLKGEDENGDEDYMKRNFENELPPWYDMKENLPDYRFDMERPKKHREFNWNDLKMLQNDFIANTKELEKKNSGLPKRYDEEKILRELDEEKQEQRREEDGENREYDDDIKSDSKSNEYHSLYPDEKEEKENVEELYSPSEETDLDGDFVDGYSKNMDDGKDDEDVKEGNENPISDVFSLQCEQFVEGVELGEAEKNCCSKQSSCPVINIMGILGHTCFCDKEFYNCLRNAGTPLAQELGEYYFNDKKNKCFTYDEKEDCRREDCVTTQTIDAVDPPKF